MLALCPRVEVICPSSLLGTVLRMHGGPHAVLLAWLHAWQERPLMADACRAWLAVQAPARTFHACALRCPLTCARPVASAAEVDTITAVGALLAESLEADALLSSVLAVRPSQCVRRACRGARVRADETRNARARAQWADPAAGEWMEALTICVRHRLAPADAVQAWTRDLLASCPEVVPRAAVVLADSLAVWCVRACVRAYAPARAP